MGNYERPLTKNILTLSIRIYSFTLIFFPFKLSGFPYEHFSVISSKKKKIFKKKNVQT